MLLLVTLLPAPHVLRLLAQVFRYLPPHGIDLSGQLGLLLRTEIPPLEMCLGLKSFLLGRRGWPTAPYPVTMMGLFSSRFSLLSLPQVSQVILVGLLRGASYSYSNDLLLEPNALNAIDLTQELVGMSKRVVIENVLQGTVPMRDQVVELPPPEAGIRCCNPSNSLVICPTFS